MSETYSKAKERLLCELASKGWKVSSGLKIPHATREDGFRVWFKSQAVYYSKGTDFSDARSMFLETRGVSTDKFIAAADWWSKDHPELLQSTLPIRKERISLSPRWHCIVAGFMPAVLGADLAITAGGKAVGILPAINYRDHICLCKGQ